MLDTTGKAVQFDKSVSQQLVAWLEIRLEHTVDIKNGARGLSNLFLEYNHLCSNERFSRCATNAAISVKVVAVPPAQKQR